MFVALGHHKRSSRRLAADKTSMFVPFRPLRNKRNKTEQTSAFFEARVTNSVTFRHSARNLDPCPTPKAPLASNGSEIGDK